MKERFTRTADPIKHEKPSLADIDYKNISLLRGYLTDSGKIVPIRRCGLTAKAQRKLAKEVRRARFLGLLPYTD